MMLSDYEKSADRARAALSKGEPGK
jgi:hypothetical protein